MSQRSSHTHCQVAQAYTQAKTWQRVCLPHPEKIELKKISSPSENKKYPTALPNTTQTMTLKLNNDNGLKRWTDRRPTGNMRLASCGVKCLNSSSVFQINFSAGLTVLCSEIPHERQAQKRWQKY
jgi:hypothetical protein